MEMGDDDRADGHDAQRDPAGGDPRDGERGLHGGVVQRIGGAGNAPEPAQPNR